MDLTKKIFAVITGASQGIGRTIALELSKSLGNGSTVILVARNVNALNDVKTMILSANGNISVNVVALDLSNPDIAEFEMLFNVVVEQYDYAVIFHNAGQTGILDATIELTDIDKWRKYFDLSLFSVGILNSIFVKHMRKRVTQRIIIVDISSLLATKAFANMAMYGAAKAARQIYFKTFALEEHDVNVLIYCPGPVDTILVSEIISNVSDAATKKNFVDLKETQMLLAPVTTVKKLLAILQKGDYASGDAIDYYDRM